MKEKDTGKLVAKIDKETLKDAIKGTNNTLTFIGGFDSFDDIPTEKIKIGTIVCVKKSGFYKEYLCSWFDTETNKPEWAEIDFAPMGRSDVLAFIKSFKKMRDKVIPVLPGEQWMTHAYEDAIETVFSRGFCYWFARILKERFDGTVVYSPADNHFACLIDEDYYDIKGHIGSANVISWFINWEEYKKQDKSDAQRIYRDCILKLPSDFEIDKENSTCMGIKLKVYNEEEEL